VSDLHVQHEDMGKCRAHARSLFLATAALLAVDTLVVFVLQVGEPFHSIGLIVLGWLLSGLWKYQRLIETITEQMNERKP
jgi:hypothetical protein